MYVLVVAISGGDIVATSVVAKSAPSSGSPNILSPGGKQPFKKSNTNICMLFQMLSLKGDLQLRFLHRCISRCLSPGIIVSSNPAIRPPFNHFGHVISY